MNDTTAARKDELDTLAIELLHKARGMKDAGVYDAVVRLVSAVLSRSKRS